MAGFRARGIDSINMDLIYGLPGQTVAKFAASLEKIIGMAPDRIALFNFAYVPSLRPHMKLIKPEDMPTPDVKLEILATTVERLRDAGYAFIGMDHFAKPDDPLTQAWKNGELHRNFQGYTTKGGLEMVGFGMSAISMLDGLYVQNHSKIATYDQAIDAGELATWRGYRLTQDDRLRRGIINRLMCHYVIDLPLIESEMGEEFDDHFPGVSPQLDDLAGRRIAGEIGPHLCRHRDGPPVVAQYRHGLRTLTFPICWLRARLASQGQFDPPLTEAWRQAAKTRPKCWFH